MVGGPTISALQDHCICGVRRLYPCVPRPGRSDGLGAFGLRDRAENMTGIRSGSHGFGRASDVQSGAILPVGAG